MKRLLIFLTALTLSSAMWSQEVLTVVYATSDDGFLNVRQQPSRKSRILTQLWMFRHGLGQGVDRGQKIGNWSKVSVGNITGWAYTKYLGYQNWYKGDGSPRLVATSEPTILYTDNYEDGSQHNVFSKVGKGTILGDTFSEDETYYILMTAHDNLYIKKTDAKIIK